MATLPITSRRIYSQKNRQFSDKVVPMRKKKVAVVKQEMKGIYVERRGEFDLLDSVRATYEGTQDPFTAEEMLNALLEAANGKQPFNLNQRRVNSMLTACCMQYGLKELEDGRYTA